MAADPVTAARLCYLRSGVNVSRSLPDVTITADAAALISHEALRSHDGLETGGILLGLSTPDRALIRHAGGPGPAARRAEATFHRDLKHAQFLAAQAWETDGSQWIGEWHTHPRTSPTDLQSYLRHLHDPDLSFVYFVSIIVVLQRDQLAMATWIIDRSQARSVALTVDT